MFNNLIGKNKELGRFLFCERYTLPPVKNAIYIAEGQDLKRGAVVDVNGVLVGTNSLMPYAVLEFDCDTRSGGKEASVFIKGEFNFDKLHFASGLYKSDLDNIVYNGSGLGIVIKPYEYAEGFSPLMVPAGTSQSNPLMNAEETERMINAMKPIDDMTLRFEFSKKDYNPNTAGVGSAGTWTKVDSPTLNIWDWTTDATDWTSAFQGAFPDEYNEVRVIAAGDTSSVTKMDKLFAGVYTNNPNQTSYSLTSRNNVVSCIPFDASDASMSFMFTGTALKRFIELSTTKAANGSFADTYIEEIGDVSLKCSNASQMFARCNKLKRVGVLKFDSSTLTNCAALFWCISNYSVLEYVGGLEGTENCSDMTNLFTGCKKLKQIGGEIDFSSVTNCTATFNNCYELERIPELVGLGSSNITTMYGAFNGCSRIKEVPLFDSSHMTDARNMFTDCSTITEIPDYDFSSVTKVGSFCRGCKNVSSGIIETYNKFLDRGASITDHSRTFEDCGINTPKGRIALAQIPQSWGGLAEG